MAERTPYYLTLLSTLVLSPLLQSTAAAEATVTRVRFEQSYARLEAESPEGCVVGNVGIYAFTSARRETATPSTASKQLHIVYDATNWCTGERISFTTNAPTDSIVVREQLDYASVQQTFETIANHCIASDGVESCSYHPVTVSLQVSWTGIDEQYRNSKSVSTSRVGPVISRFKQRGNIRVADVTAAITVEGQAFPFGQIYASLHNTREGTLTMTTEQP